MSLDVMKQALEALEECTAYTSSESWSPSMTRDCEAAITALRAAIEQAQRNEFNPDWDQVEALRESLREHMAEIQRLRAAIEQAQEPFCYHDGRNIVGKEFADHSDVFPLYTVPRQWQGLTDEEISSLWDGHIVPVFGKNGINPIVFARAIEANLKEKNT